MDIQCELNDLIQAAGTCRTMNSDELSKYAKICSQQSIVIKFYSTGRLDQENPWYKSCTAIIAENQSRVFSKIGFKDQDLLIRPPNKSQSSNNSNNNNNTSN